MFFLTFVSLIVPSMLTGEYCHTLLVAILAGCNGEHISHVQKILKRDEE